MDYTLHVALIAIAVFRIDVRTVSCKDYCTGESLKASCLENQVVMIQEATYGRMKAGRCIDHGSEYVGCSANVRTVADKICSGRQSCEIRVSNAEMDAVMNCNRDFVRYLSASYTCETVLGVATTHCQSEETIKTTFIKSYIASATTNQTRCGLESAPYSIQALPGQRLSFALLDFFHYAPSEGRTRSHYTNCATKYGYIEDLDSKTRVEICRSSDRVKELLVSKYHSVKLVLHRDAVRKYSFLIEVTVLGCHDIFPPEHAWMTRDGNEITVGCHSHRQTWHLTCKENRWIGVIGNCSRGALDREKAAAVRSGHGNIPPGITIVFIGLISAVICGVIIFIGVLCLKRTHINSTTKGLVKQIAQGNMGKDIYKQPKGTSNTGERPDRNHYMHISEHAQAEVLTEETDGNTEKYQRPIMIPDYCGGQLSEGSSYMDEYLLSIHNDKQSVSLDMNRAIMTDSGGNKPV